TYVDLMMDDIFIQTCPLIINESVIYSIHGDIIPMDRDTTNLIKVTRNESSIWLNELTWNPFSKTLHLEAAGKPDYDYQYFVVNQNEPFWDIESDVGFEIQFIDSSFVLGDDLVLPTVISLELSSDDELITLEHIVLDTLPFAISRMPDGDSWHYTESITLGSTNQPIADNYVTDLVPEFFVLYQNYPNPFNGQTRITFDLLEDAAVTLYITDATGRIHDKLIEEEFIISGTYNYMWNGEGRSSGIYFITLQAQVDQIPPAVLSRKMIYLK
ncbi:MAG: T9SS type A sorting domain-containing protein, partial [Candidatus Neomarinimicrobiota bacterium]|nr:T9SS type A sorting domain-containing protein [Candidatus Neomarinimicrobiota bacterium]